MKQTNESCTDEWKQGNKKLMLLCNREEGEKSQRFCTIEPISHNNRRGCVTLMIEKRLHKQWMQTYALKWWNTHKNARTGAIRDVILLTGGGIISRINMLLRNDEKSVKKCYQLVVIVDNDTWNGSRVFCRTVLCYV